MAVLSWGQHGYVDNTATCIRGGSNGMQCLGWSCPLPAPARTCFENEPKMSMCTTSL